MIRRHDQLTTEQRSAVRDAVDLLAWETLLKAREHMENQEVFRAHLRSGDREPLTDAWVAGTVVGTAVGAMTGSNLFDDYKPEEDPVLTVVTIVSWAFAAWSLVNSLRGLQWRGSIDRLSRAVEARVIDIEAQFAAQQMSDADGWEPRIEMSVEEVADARDDAFRRFEKALGRSDLGLRDVALTRLEYGTVDAAFSVAVGAEYRSRTVSQTPAGEIGF